MSKSDQPATGHEITYERPSFQSRSKLFIDGRWITAEGDGDTAVLDSATEALVGEVGAATFDQLDSAVRAAQRAQLPWSSLSGAARFLRRTIAST